MKRRIIAVLLVCAGVLGMRAQTLDVDGERLRWEGALNVGLNNDGFECEISAAFFSVQYVGIKLGLGVAGEIMELEDWNDDQYIPYDEYAMRFKFSPSVVLRSPKLVSLRREDAGFYLFAEPGIVLSPGATGSRGAKYFRWNMRCGINFQVDRFIATLGYGVSNFSLYSGQPVNHWGLPDKSDYNTHTVYLSAGVKF